MHQKPDYRHESLTNRLHDVATDRLNETGEKALASDVTGTRGTRANRRRTRHGNSSHSLSVSAALNLP